MAKGFTKNGSPQRAESKVQPWFERRFDFNFPIAQFPNICVRLRGTPARLEEIVKDAATDLFTAKPDGKWSAQEHVGHLFDLEPLWMARVEDFLTDGDTLTVADLTNRKTDEANHNSRTLREIVADFRAARLHLVSCIGRLQPKVFASSRLHPRLKQSIRLVDHLVFVAEHDDHHLARICEIVDPQL